MINGLYRTIRQLKINKIAIQEAKKVQATPSRILFYNWWTPQTTEAWFYRFAETRGLLRNTQKQIAFFSVFGPREVISYDNSDIRIFYTGENTHLYGTYADHFMEDKRIQLALGFDYFEDERYLRFPIWLRLFFKPDSTQEVIHKQVSQLCLPSVSVREYFCSMIASHDDNGIRRDMVQQLSKINLVASAGKFMHNDDLLKTRFSDDKIAYLRQFAFNICPENSNSFGYVTEKIFDAIQAGCIPIYWGSFNNPEPEVLNKDAILFWNSDGENSAVLKQIEDLYAHPRLLDDFLHQPRLLPTAEEYVIKHFNLLENRLRQLLS